MKASAGAEGHWVPPLKYPQKETAQGVPICRYFNYDMCKKADRCPYDHMTCHCCGEKGHRAKDCAAFG